MSEQSIELNKTNDSETIVIEINDVHPVAEDKENCFSYNKICAYISVFALFFIILLLSGAISPLTVNSSDDTP